MSGAVWTDELIEAVEQRLREIDGDAKSILENRFSYGDSTPTRMLEDIRSAAAISLRDIDRVRVLGPRRAA